jgi:hypothetical protein
MTDETTKPEADEGHCSQSSGTKIPRWARDLATAERTAEETWERIEELLNDGFDAPDVVRELALPESKLRSLQIHARKFGPRRRLAAFATFKDALLSGAVENRAKFIAALGVICGHAVSTEISESKQQNAFALMTDFTQILSKLMAADEKAEQPAKEVKIEVTDARQKLSAKAIQDIRDVYGIPPDDGNAGVS